MSGTKRKRVTLDDLLERPWCYYCEKDFDDLAILQTHQREKHFACENGCTRKLNTAAGLQVHTQQVHKKTIERIRNALPGREDPTLEIFGIMGIPEEVLVTHKQNIIDGYYQHAAQFRAKTGNPLPGTVKQDPNTKGPRGETKEDIKARVAARVAEVQAQRAAAAAAANGQAAQPGNHAASNVSMASQLQPPAMAGIPPALSNSNGVGNPNGTGNYGHPTQGYGASSSPHNMMGTPNPAAVYQQGTALTPTTAPAAGKLPPRPEFGPPTLSRSAMNDLHSTNGRTLPPVIVQTKTCLNNVMELDAKVSIGKEPTSIRQLVHDVLGSAQLTSSPGAYLVWFTHGFTDAKTDAITLEEMKSGAGKYGCHIPADAQPTRTVLAE